LAAAQAEGWQSYSVEPSHHLGTYGRERFGLSIVEGELCHILYPVKPSVGDGNHGVTCGEADLADLSVGHESSVGDGDAVPH
jgi:hypothetical protein